MPVGGFGRGCECEAPMLGCTTGGRDETYAIKLVRDWAGIGGRLKGPSWPSREGSVLVGRCVRERC